MQKIKENLKAFFITWGIVLLLNQVFLFHGCFNPVCLIAALPHTGVIAFIILIFFINDEKNKKSIDTKNEYDESEIMRRYSEGYKIVRELNRKNTPSQNSIKPREQEVKIVENLISDLEKNNEIQEENKICKITQVKNFLHSFEPFEITIMDVRNNILQINTEVIEIKSIDSNDYFIEKPKNDTWKNVALKSGDKCLVKKQSYGTKIELNLLEINGEKIKSKITKLPKVQKDIELESLKKELNNLESKLQELVEQKTEYLNDIEEFSREYNLHLGEIIKEILNLKREILYKKTIKQQKQKAKYQEDIQIFQESKETIDELKSTIAELEEALESIDEDDENYKELTQAYNELKEELEKLENELELQEKELELAKEYIEDESIEKEYEEVNNHYEEFESEYEHIKKAFENSIILNDEEKKELKSLYKQAARLCHPDIVPDELKEKAHELMQKLNDAYSKKDLSKVKEILHSLQNGTSFEVSSETIEDKELLRAKIKEYLKNIETIKSEIEDIKEDETYQTIAELDDWDEYFEELKGGLEIEKERLENEALEVEQEKTSKPIEKKASRSQKTKSTKVLSQESSPYAKHILSIEVPNFEKIRRYYQNLVDDNEADEMQTYLAQYGKMHKALIYDALEQFIERLDGQSITLIDWGCGQGIASLLVLDYLREKQLNIKIEKVILIGNDTKYLSRAMLHVDVLKQNDIDIEAIDVTHSQDIEKLNQTRTHLSLNLFANDAMPLDYLDIESDIFENAYFMCVSNESNERIDAFFEGISDFIDIDKIITDREAKIGRFKKFEKIFSLDKI